MSHVSHVANAPHTDVIPKCQPPGGLSCPVVPQLVALPTLSLKALTFIRLHRAARGPTWHLAICFPSVGGVLALVLSDTTRVKRGVGPGLDANSFHL